jgi:lysophospholipid acyltransferase (LPLAT)-like uncharacterized protein
MRRLRFLLVERIFLPMAIVPFKLLVRSWRRADPDPDALRAVLAAPRIVLLTFHGMLLHLVAFSVLANDAGRRLVVMLSPSLDGRLLAAFLSHFGIDHVSATTGSRGAAGSREFIRRIAAGDVGVIAVDGPRGPCCSVAPGFARIARAADAAIGLIATSADRGVRFGSWDRAHLPLPFARIAMSIRFPVANDAAAVETELLGAAHALQSPVLPPPQSARFHMDGRAPH